MRILGKSAIPLLVAFTLVGAGCRADLEMGRGALSKHPEAPRVDLTIALVDLITSDPKQRKAALEILEQEPVPLESLRDQKD